MFPATTIDRRCCDDDDGANDDDDGRGRDGLLRSIEGSFRTIDRLKVESGLFD